jgi:hypothetical protein
MAFEKTSTETLLALRGNMIRGAVRVALKPAPRDEAGEMVHIQVALVDIIDIVLTERGVEFTPPVWR